MTDWSGKKKGRKGGEGGGGGGKKKKKYFPRMQGGSRIGLTTAEGLYVQKGERRREKIKGRETPPFDSNFTQLNEIR